jgi:hypothetical protein
MAALSCNDLTIWILDPKMSETNGKIKNVGVGFIQIGAVKRHRRAIKDCKVCNRRPVLEIPKIFDRMTMTFGCTILNETNVNIFFILSLVSHILGSR